MHTFLSALASLVCAALALGGTGCTNSSLGATEYGALGGAASGAGLGAIIGHQSGNAGVGVAIGAAAGALGGALVGSQVDRQDQAINDRQLRIDQQEQTIAENARLIEELRQRGIDVRDSDRGVVVNLPDVLFETGKAQLTRSAQEIVFEISQVIQRAPSRHLLVEGHTDSVGTIEYNYRLSESRAQEVASALESNGIPRRMISTHALGETTPIATNRTEQGRRRNRRVEVIVENVGH
jgi:outer membrane protein OmpA-like peptidoglycan-associated protein